MLYIGHFSYDELGHKMDPRHGYFSYVVDAENTDGAVELFTEDIVKLKKTEYFFANVVKVYIEDIIRIPKTPTQPLMTEIRSCEGEFPRTISYSLPFDKHVEAEAFGLPSNVDKHERKASEEYFKSDAFIEFKVHNKPSAEKQIDDEKEALNSGVQTHYQGG